MPHPQAEAFDQTVDWMRDASFAIQRAGGNVEGVLSMFPKPLLHTLIANNIKLIYKPSEEPDYGHQTIQAR